MSDIAETHHGVVQTREKLDQRTGSTKDTTVATGLSLAITKERKSSAWRANDHAAVLASFYIGRHHTSDPEPLPDDVFEASDALYVVTEVEPFVPTILDWDTGHRTRLKRVARGPE